MASQAFQTRRRPFFIGWYFKHQNQTETLAFIPGLQIDEQGNRSSFLQVIRNSSSYVQAYPYDSFFAAKNELLIRVGNNVFSKGGIHIELSGDGFSCKGSVAYGPFLELEKDIMGPFRMLPFMECSHQVLSMGHWASGQFEWKDKQSREKIVFEKGSSGYLEMDYGTSFPKEYAWLQCNRFGEEACSIMAAIAIIPIFETSFLGTTCVLQWNGKTHTLATFQGAKVNTFRENRLVVEQGAKRLEVDVIRDLAHPLQAPQRGAMDRTIHESPQCKARVLLTVDHKIVLDLFSQQASYEFVKN